MVAYNLTGQFRREAAMLANDVAPRRTELYSGLLGRTVQACLLQDIEVRDPAVSGRNDW